MDSTIAPPIDGCASALSDGELVSRILAGECALFEIVMRRHNQQLYRAARAILTDEADIEDVMQQAYLNAFAHLAQFEARSQLSTWLTRIVINEAYAKRRRQRVPVCACAGRRGGSTAVAESVASSQPGPEQQAYAGELQRLLEEAVDELPETYRVVFMLRDVEGLSTTETGAALALGEEAVKTRLHRARAMLRRAVAAARGRRRLLHLPVPRPALQPRRRRRHARASRVRQSILTIAASPPAEARRSTGRYCFVAAHRVAGQSGVLIVPLALAADRIRPVNSTPSATSENSPSRT